MKTVFTALLMALVFGQSLPAQVITWRSVTSPKGAPVATLLKTGDALYAGYLGGGLFYLEETLDSFVPAGTGIKPYNVTDLADGGGELYVSAFDGVFALSLPLGQFQNLQAPSDQVFHTVHVHRSDIFVGSNVGLYRYGGQPGNWERISLPGQDTVRTSIYSISSLNNLVVAGSDRRVYYKKGNSAWVGTDNVTPFAITSLVPARGNSFYVGTTGSGVFEVKLNNPNNPTRVPSQSSAPERQLVPALYFDEEKDMLVQASVRNGVLTDEQNQLGPQTLDPEVWSITKSGEFYYCGTHAMGVFRLSTELDQIPGKSLVELPPVPKALPDDLHEMIIFPNPASEEITLKWSRSLNNAEVYDIRIYSTDGRLVFSKRVSSTEPARYEIAVNQYPAGAYQCRLSSSKKTLVTRSFIVHHPSR